MMANAQAAVWTDLSTAPRWRRALQRAWLERLAVLLNTPTANAQQREATFKLLPVLGVSRNFGELDLVTAADTLLPAWAQDALPALAGRRDQAAAAAARGDDRLHFRQMALMARRAVPLPLVARP